jgi:PIN domain nuclease of toxin-antitoxin system
VKLLLDTHVFIWLVEGDPRLSRKAQAAIADRDTDLLFSIASIWEMGIKVGNEKLKLAEPLETYVDRWLNGYQIDVLTIHKQHALAVAAIPQHHRDPFDRLLIAQAISEGAAIVSGDSMFVRYSVTTIW